MSLVCVNNQERLYVKPEYIHCIETKQIKDDEEHPDNPNGYTSYVEVTYWVGSQIRTHRIYMASYSIDTYCKSLQAHIAMAERT